MDNLIVTFCEDRRSWLVVIAGTLALALVLVLPAVDDYVAVSKENNDIAQQLALAEQSARMLGGLERQRAEQAAVLTEQQEKTLHEGNEAEYRNTIVKMVRETGCQLRRIQIGAPTARDWVENDSPLEKTTGKKLKPTGFKLERRQVTLSLAGTSANVRRLIEQFEKQDTQVHVQRLELRPGGADGRRVELSMELWYFTLTRGTA